MNQNDRIQYIVNLAKKLGEFVGPDSMIKGTKLSRLCEFDGGGYKRIVAWYEKKISELPSKGDGFVTNLKEKQTYETGATRDLAVGKGRYDLMPPEALKRIALVYERGAEKHGGNNWKKGIPYSRLVSSALRHISQFQEGLVDEDHLGHAVWNLMALIYFEEKKIDNLNDLNA